MCNLISSLKVTSCVILSLVQYSVLADSAGAASVPQAVIQQPQTQLPQTNNYGNTPGNSVAPSGYYDDTNAAPIQSGGTVEYVDPGYVGDGGVIVAPGAGVVVGPGEVPAYEANELRNGVNPNVINQEREDQINRYNAEQNQQRMDQNRGEMPRGGEYRGGGFQRR